MRRVWMVTAIVMLGCKAALAQVGGSPGTAATSPLGMSGGSQLVPSVGPTGIPLGATELNTPGLSPMLTDPTGMAAWGATCSPAGGGSTGISGAISSASTYDGGGVTTGGGMGDGTALPGSATICGSTSSGTPWTLSARSISPNGVSRTGIPLGSVEIGSAGVSPLITVPTPTMLFAPLGTPGSSPSALGTLTAPSTLVAPTSPTAGIGLTTNQSAMPCGSIITSGPATFC
jgi:hypothetical protein